MSYDIVVIGAGAAGLTFIEKTLKLNKSLKICLIEAGNLTANNNLGNYDDISFKKKKINPVDEKRAFLFGGTTNLWGGMCRNLDEEDFFNRSDINKYGWPFGIDELNKYSIEAQEVLELKNSFDVDKNYEDEELLKKFNLEEISFDYSNREVFFNKYNYLKEKVDIKLDHLAYKFIIDDKNKKINSLEVIYTTKNKKKIINSDYFIVAMGGVETTRFLLFNNSFNNKNYFNSSNKLGVGFNDHPHLTVGEFVSFKDFHNNKIKKNVRFFKNSYNFQKKNKILNSSIRLIAKRNPNVTNYNLVEEYKNLFPNVNKKILYTGRVIVVSEQHSNNKNTISLSTEKKDKYNIPLSNFDFSLSDLDFKTIRETSLNISKWLADIDYARVKLKDWLLDDQLQPKLDEYTWWGHHMGTTRMGNIPSESIVDKNLKFHTLSNGYVLSSSTFPSGGASNPTYTIVQLSLRLANHLKSFI